MTVHSIQQARYRQMLVSPHVGGGAKLAMAIHRHARNTRGEVSSLLLPGGGEAERVAQLEQFPFTRYDVRQLTGPSRMRSVMENLRLFAANRPPRGCVIHVHAPFVYGAARTFFAMSGVKTVLHVHLDFSADELRWALRSAPDCVLVCAEYMRPAVEEALGSRRDSTCVRVIPNAVEVARFVGANRAAAKERLGIRTDRPLLMVAANLAPHKGQATTIAATSLLKQWGRDVQLWIVGAERSDGRGYLDELKRQAAAAGVEDRTEFAGFRSDVPQLLQAADFLLLPSTSEGLPLVIMEAQASKALVLAAPTAGIPEVVKDGKTGFLIAADDPHSYARRIAALLDEPAIADQIREAALQNVSEHHDMSTYCERVIGLYDELLDGEAA